nr:MAG TPA: hypothetical protein [Caudoviricetes sp.]
MIRQPFCLNKINRFNAAVRVVRRVIHGIVVLFGFGRFLKSYLFHIDTSICFLLP